MLHDGVLRELQSISDSSDPRRRTRGRRGLDVLVELQKSPTIQLQLVEETGVSVVYAAPRKSVRVLNSLCGSDPAGGDVLVGEPISVLATSQTRMSLMTHPPVVFGVRERSMLSPTMK